MSRSSFIATLFGFVYIVALLQLVDGAVKISQLWQLDPEDFRWVDKEVALIRSENPSQVWRTADGGSSWVQVVLEGSEKPNSAPAFLYPNDVDSSRIYIRGHGETSWISEDKGETWTAIKPGKRFINLEWHPTKVDFAIATTAESGGSEVYVTIDFCRTWTLVAAGAFQYDWGDAGLGNIPQDRIYMIREDSDGYRNFVATDNFGESQLVLQSRTFQFLFRPKNLFTIVLLPTNGDVILKETPYLGYNVRPFYEAKFPFGKELPNNGYVILDDSTGAVYLGVNHGAFNSHWGNIYVSNSLGNQYSLSNRHVSQLYPAYDFDKLNGIDGIFITNVVENWESETDTKHEDKLQTYITFDNGGKWKALKPPRFDSHGKKIDCNGKCALHLHGWTGFVNNFLGPFYSTDNAKGLILATGNVGEFLNQEVDAVNTYFSRDAGVSWVELMEGSSIYEFGDHGAIIVLAGYGRPVKEIFYTLNEGKDIESLQISTTPVNVLNIRTEPTAISTKFVVFVQIIETQKLAMIGIDFSQVFNRTCGASDYEEWAPSDGKTDIQGLKCLLGKEIIYKRRKPDAMCFNAQDLDHVVSVKFCECTEEDWECDFDFEPSSDGTGCRLVGSEPTYPPEYCYPGLSYNKTAGYRKVAGTACHGGVSHWGDGPFVCPSNNNEKASKAWIAAVVIVILVVVLLLVGGLVAIRSDKVREKVPFLKVLGDWKIGYFGVRSNPGTLMEEGPDEEFVIGSLEEDHTELSNGVGLVDLQDDKANGSKDSSFDSFDPRAS